MSDDPKLVPHIFAVGGLVEYIEGTRVVSADKFCLRLPVDGRSVEDVVRAIRVALWPGVRAGMTVTLDAGLSFTVASREPARGAWKLLPLRLPAVDHYLTEEEIRRAWIDGRVAP